jgi:hypothetical protein
MHTAAAMQVQDKLEHISTLCWVSTSTCVHQPCSAPLDYLDAYAGTYDTVKTLAGPAEATQLFVMLKLPPSAVQ